MDWALTERIQCQERKVVCKHEWDGIPQVFSMFTVAAISCRWQLLMLLLRWSKWIQWWEHCLLCGRLHYSPKKAEKLVEIQTVLNTPELKVHKPSETRWLAWERCVRAVRKSLPALVLTFEQIYSESGDAEAFGLAKIMCTYKSNL